MSDLNVHIGEVKVGRETDVLKALLGSCLGIAFIWKEKGVYGLAHCLLPEPVLRTDALGGKYVTQAIPTLLNLMNVDPSQYREIDAIITGGGNMTNPKVTGPQDLIGFMNAKTAREELRKLRIRLIHEEVGGLEGRRILVNCTTGKFEIEKIPRIIPD